MKGRAAGKDPAAGGRAAVCDCASFAATVWRGDEVVVAAADARALHVELGDAALHRPL